MNQIVTDIWRKKNRVFQNLIFRSTVFSCEPERSRVQPIGRSSKIHWETERSQWRSCDQAANDIVNQDGHNENQAASIVQPVDQQENQLINPGDGQGPQIKAPDTDKMVEKGDEQCFENRRRGKSRSRWLTISAKPHEICDGEFAAGTSTSRMRRARECATTKKQLESAISAAGTIKTYQPTSSKHL